ncbi:hypothetical protein H1S01_11135 [Heliobacterium chlorum]|uniref:Uncharacterized protein n=1 Tax=Heliobacterium chlorum TaxID=2698 RepID=A0ABR7T5F5_HELCL|nr:hypothetical protein [Heliobacterium chlorum]MBC9785064.1 hypothetical protein [Heliobacterium chlorum]
MKSSIFSVMAIILPIYLFLTVLWPGGPGQQYLLMVMIAVLAGPALYQSWPFVKERFWGTNSTTITPSVDDQIEPATPTAGMTMRPWIVSLSLLLFGWWWDMLFYYGIVAAINLGVAIYILVQNQRARRNIV